jgi:WD40 repeat protein
MLIFSQRAGRHHGLYKADGWLDSALPTYVHMARVLALQVQFSQDGNFLYTGARQDGNILCWDIRNTGEVLYTMQRDTLSTNQRVQFSIEPGGRHLATGETCSQCGMPRLVPLASGDKADEGQVEHSGAHVSACTCRWQ